ncbi:TPA: transcriptional regulator [Serratia marcescens]
MKYIINNNIKYHEDRAELTIVNGDAQPQPLTATLNRLLSALVRNNNVVLSREALLTQVWKDHGQVASENNLNNAISLLRKIFISLGEDEIIVTMPRQGFMFTAGSLETADSLMPASSTSRTTAPRLATTLAIARFKIPILATLSFLIIITGVIWIWLNAGYASLKAVKVGVIGECDVKFVTSYYNVSAYGVDLEHLKHMLASRKKDYCTEPATLLYYDSTSVVPDGVGRVRNSYFYYCPKSKMSIGKTQCENIHESWEK